MDDRTMIQAAGQIHNMFDPDMVFETASMYHTILTQH